jgi:Ca2+-binding EF-hand superfamily protein
MRKSKTKLSEEKIESIIKEVDFAGNGKINYSEFLVATIDLSAYLDENKLMEVF